MEIRKRTQHALNNLLGLGRATLLQLAVFGESDSNFPREKFPLGQQSVRTKNPQGFLYSELQNGLEQWRYHTVGVCHIDTGVCVHAAFWRAFVSRVVFGMCMVGFCNCIVIVGVRITG